MTNKEKFLQELKQEHNAKQQADNVFSATIRYHMRLSNLNTEDILRELQIARSTWFNYLKDPCKFTRGLLLKVEALTGMHIFAENQN